MTSRGYWRLYSQLSRLDRDKFWKPSDSESHSFCNEYFDIAPHIIDITPVVIIVI